MAKKKLYVEKYFEGYATREVTKANGSGTRTVSVYEGDVYSLNLDRRGVVLKKLRCVLFLLIYFAAVIVPAVLDAAVNHTKYSVVISGACQIIGCYLLKAVIDLLAAKEEMTRFECEELKKSLSRSSQLVLIFSAVAALMYIISFGFTAFSGGAVLQELLCVLISGLGCAAAYGMYREEKRTDYVIVKKGTYARPKEEETVRKKFSWKLNTHKDGASEPCDDDVNPFL